MERPATAAMSSCPARLSWMKPDWPGRPRFRRDTRNDLHSHSAMPPEPHGGGLLNFKAGKRWDILGDGLADSPRLFVAINPSVLPSSPCCVAVLPELPTSFSESALEPPGILCLKQGALRDSMVPCLAICFAQKPR